MPVSNIHKFTEYQEAFETGLDKVHRDTLKTIPKTYAAWLAEVPAKHFYDTEWTVSNLGVMPEKTIGGAVETDKIYKAPTKRYEMVPYALALVIQYEVFRWDLYGIFPGLMKELAKSATDRYNLVAYSILNNGFSTSDAKYQTFQGEVLFSDSHTRLDGGTWNNTDTVELSYLGIKQAEIDLSLLVNERGRYTPVSPQQLITGVQQGWIARNLLNTTGGQPGTTDHSVNTTSFRKLHTSPYITSTTAWWVQGPKGDVKMHLRLGDSPKMMFDGDWRTMNRVGQCYCSFDIAIWDSRGFWASTGGG